MAVTRPSGPDETMMVHYAAVRGVKDTYPGGMKKKWPVAAALAVLAVLVVAVAVLWGRFGSRPAGQGLPLAAAVSGQPGTVVDENGETRYQWGMGPGPSDNMK